MSILDLGKPLLQDQRNRYRTAIEEYWFEYLLLLPTVVFVVGLLWLPFMRGVWMSFHEWPILGDSTWVGLGNYEYLFGWDVFYTSLWATLVFVSSTIFQLVIAIVAALVIKHQTRFQNILSSSFLVPFTMPPVVTGTIWLFLLDPDLGPVFTVLLDFGVLSNPIYWGVDSTLALLVVTAVNIWTFWPFMFLIIYASLENIPEQYYETAEIYGAGSLSTFRHVTLPHVKSAIYVAVAIRIVWNFAKVSQPLQITRGGPGFATSVLGILLYRLGYSSGDLGIAFAIGIVLLALTLLAISPFIRAFEAEGGT